MTTYQEKLKDPRWQKKRLQVFERDNWACIKCGGTDVSLHVHHKKYYSEPWDAPMEDLETLCRFCHESESNDGIMTIQCETCRCELFPKNTKKCRIYQKTDIHSSCFIPYPLSSCNYALSWNTHEKEVRCIGGII